MSHVDFGAHDDELIVTSALNLGVHVWNLALGTTQEIRDPKFSGPRSYSIRSRTGHLAVLTRSNTKDSIIIFNPERTKLDASFTIATSDAQGIEWSPDGNLLVTWEAGSSGHLLLVYTATGHLYKKWTRDSGDTEPSCGISKVQWDPHGRYLVVASNEGQVVLLNTKSFLAIATLGFASTISSNRLVIHEERIGQDQERSYGLAQRSATVPEKSSTLGFTYLTISEAGLLASVRGNMPTTVWIHSLEPQRQLTAVLIHHEPVKSLSWHPKEKRMLLMHTGPLAPSSTSPPELQGATPKTSSIHVWGYDLPNPLIIPLHTDAQSQATKVSWLKPTSAIRCVLVTTPTGCATMQVSETDTKANNDMDMPIPKALNFPPPPWQRSPVPIMGYGPEDAFDVDDTPLTVDFSPIKMNTAHLTSTLGFQLTSLNNVDTDDTFDFKRITKK